MLQLANRYRVFLDDVFSGIAETPALAGWPHAMPELDLQSLWFAGEFGSDFTTTDGRRVVIRDFGIWNHSAGPDFTGCAVDLDGKTLRGDIELDPDARDWERHGHGANAAYENVVLHLFTAVPEGQRFYTRTAGHREILQVHLTGEMLHDSARPRPLPEARLGRCATPLALMDETRAESFIEAAAQYRLQRKGAKLTALIRIHGREQAVYQSLANALGYRANQRPFTVLAQRLPLRELLRRNVLEREALIFGVSGFLESVRYEDTEPETRIYLRELWSEWWKVRDIYLTWLDEPHRLHWTIAGARPGNHPQRRLGALTSMLRNWKRVMAPLQSAKAWSQDAFNDVMLELDHDYWSKHYTLLAAPSAKPLAMIGGTRVQEIMANVCYPLLVPENADLWSEFKQLSSALDNQKVRRAALRLFGETPRSVRMQKKLFQQQGLLQIYEDYCLEDDSACAECPFPERLKEWA
jgi:hypothetical protein